MDYPAPRVLCQLRSVLFVALVRFLGVVIGFCYHIGVGAELGFDLFIFSVLLVSCLLFFADCYFISMV
jgi:hypothetical protein